MDRSFGQPGEGGGHGRGVTLTTDRDGGFRYDFAPTPYSIAYFVFPPIGAVPGKPPLPIIGIRDGAQAYWVGSDHHRFDYRIISPSGSAERDSAQRITGAYAFRELPPRPGKAEKEKGWELALTIHRR
jgi:hypothetical protein